ncbi:MAG: outer membrane beta-barrel protein, partial [Sphingobacteriaceae bacterium]|nr:outer membrane beta-barrel protein [Cytophagaceae bacterium]
PHDYDTRYDYLTEARQSREGITIRKNTPIGMLVLKGDYAGTWKKNSLEFGAKTTRMRLTNDVSVQRNLDGTWKPDPEFSQNYFLEDAIDAAYLNLQRPLGKGKLQAGLRYEHTSTDIGTPGSGAGLVRRRYGSWFPSLFWALDFSKKSGIQLAYSRRIQRPDYALLAPFVFFSDPNTFITGNATLLPTFSDAVQGTYRFRENYLLTLRYSHDRDALDRFRVRVDSSTNRSFITPQNIRSLNTLALTLAFPVRVASWWQMQTNLLGVYQRADASVEGQALVFAQANANLSSTHTFKLPREFSAELTAFYQSPALNGISRRLAFGAVGLGIQKKLSRNRGTLRLSLSDAFRTNFMRIVSDNPAVNQVANWTLRFDSRVLRLTFTRSLGSQSVKAATRRATGSEDERGRVSTN